MNSLKQKPEAKTAVTIKGKKIKWADEEKKALAIFVMQGNEKTPERKAKPINFIDELEKISKLSTKKSTPVKPKGQSNYVTRLNRDITSMGGEKKIGFCYDDYLKGCPYKKLQKPQSVKLYLIHNRNRKERRGHQVQVTRRKQVWRHFLINKGSLQHRICNDLFNSRTQKYKTTLKVNTVYDPCTIT